MIQKTVMGLASLLSLAGVGFAQVAHAAPACATSCNYGVCTACDDEGFRTTCYIYNGCGGKYPIPYRASAVNAFFAPANTECASASIARPSSSVTARYLKATPAPFWMSAR